MTAIVLYFFMTNDLVSYREPMTIELAAMSCGLTGGVAGIQIDSIVNPGRVYIPDPGIVGMHCEINISNYVQGLSITAEKWWIATTVLEIGVPNTGESGPFYIGPDPHISEEFSLVGEVGMQPKKPVQLGIIRP